ncbi:ATP-dependent protease, partial [Achromatium sp. WMS1]
VFFQGHPEYDTVSLLKEYKRELRRFIKGQLDQSPPFPARFQLVAAMNPCPCGYLGDPIGNCNCTPKQISRYRDRISGPLLDRIDMHIEVPRLTPNELMNSESIAVESSAQVQKRVIQARQRQLARSGCPNNALDNRQIERTCRLDAQGQKFMHNAMERLGFSARAFHRILKLARTIADLIGDTDINTKHLSEAISYRRLDRR